MADTVSSVLLRILKKHAIRHVFGLPAIQLSLVMDGAGRDPWFKYITVRHEEACGHMAHAIAKLTNSMAMCFATVGPGATNMVPGVAAAWADNVPMLVVTPNNQADSINPPRELLQNVNQIGLYEPITKWSAQIHHADRAPELIERALYIARTGRPGPVHLDIPCDIGTAPCAHDLASIPTIERQRPVPAPAEIEKLAGLLANARRPLIIAGGGIVRSEGTEALRTLLRATHIPGIATPNARGVIGRASPSLIGSSGVLGGTAVTLACKEADLIVAIGCKFSTFIPVNKPPAYPIPAGQKIVQIDIDGASLGCNVPLTLGLVGDARESLRALTQALEGRALKMESDWLSRLRAERATFMARVGAIADAGTTPGTNKINEAALVRSLARLLPPDAIVCYDGGQVMEWAQTLIEHDDPHDSLFVPGMGHLGFGLPMANAAKLLHPERTVVCINGDGAMAMTSQELETAARYGLNVIVICGNDSHWGMYRPANEHVYDNDNFGIQLTDVNFARVAEGYGCHGEKIDSLSDFPAAFERAQRAERPAGIDVTVDFTPHPMDSLWSDVVLRGVNLTPCFL